VLWWIGVAVSLGSLAAPTSRADDADGGPAPAASSSGPVAPPEPRDKVEGKRLDALLADIAQARKGVRTLRASFTQERRLSLLATTVRSTGTLAFVSPDRLRWELAPPDDVVYLVHPEGVSYRTRTSKATVPASGGSVARALGDVRALLGGDLGQLRDRYVLTASRGPSDVELTGTARDATASVRGFTLTLDKALVLPLRAQLKEGKADSITLTFIAPQVNVPVDPARMVP
jgi:outer membrane lipoprotein-sorting protein